MSKKLHQVKLYAVLANGQKVSSSNWQDRHHLQSEDGYFKVTASGSNVVLTTSKGSYVLEKHPTQNHFAVTAKGIKVQVIVKKMVGTLIYWA